MTTLNTLALVVGQIQTDMATVTGIQSAPSAPPEQAVDFPFVVTYPEGLEESKIGPAPLYTSWWNITVEMHVARRDLPTDIATAIGLTEAVLGELHETLQSNSVAFEKISAVFGALAWGDTPTLGFRFMVHKVKIQAAVPS